MTSSTSSHSKIILNSLQNKKELASYLGKGKRNDTNRSASFNKRPSSGNILSTQQRSTSGSTKRKKTKDSPKPSSNTMMHGYTSTNTSNKFLTGKSLSKYASVDQLMYSDNSSKPSLKVKSSKLSAKTNKNSSVDSIFQQNYLDNELKYSNKIYPSNLKVKKDKSKLKKKKSKQEFGFLDKQSSKLHEGRTQDQEPLSINIVNNNHLHLSGYGTTKPSGANTLTSADTDKKENFQSIIKNFKPSNTNLKSNKSQDKLKEEKKIRAFKQEIHTTKPKKSTNTSEGSSKITPNTSKRAESEVRKPTASNDVSTSEKRSQSQPPVKEKSLVDPSIQDFVCNYAFKTRTGFIPQKEDKQNQDQYMIVQDFANIKNNWLFGVCDGHGINGHFASDHVKQYLPTNIELLDYMLLKQKEKEAQKTPEEKLESPSGFFDDDDENLTSYLLSKDRRKKYTVISEGFIKTACDIQNRSFNVDYSGTTVVSVMLTGNHLTCANVGDSRAILGSLRSKEDAAIVEQNKGEFQIESVAGPDSSGELVWMSTSLSIDHKPDRADEHERIISTNGRVDPFREENGDPVGPARVWLKTQNIPGLAMSRSIGDLVASSVGVIPEPEFFEIVLNESDKFLVIASDGVWEFIDNNECVRLVAPFWEKNDPEGACKKLTDLSVEHWKREDEVIDDITVIVVFLKIPKNPESL